MNTLQRILRHRRAHAPAPRQLSRRERAELREPVPVHLRIR